MKQFKERDPHRKVIYKPTKNPNTDSDLVNYRKAEIKRMFAEGMNRSEIANELGMTISNINHYTTIYGIRRKSKCESAQ